MKKQFYTLGAALLIASTFLATAAKSQNAIYYNIFKGNLKADTTNGKLYGPDLIADGPGGIVNDTMPLLHPHIAKSFGFNEGTGLKFDDVAAGNFLGKSYSIEIYYKYQSTSNYRRLLEFHNYVGADSGMYVHDRFYDYYPLPNSNSATQYISDNTYAHFVFTRDNSTTYLKGYNNGTEVLSTFDVNESATIKNGNYLEMFKDDGSENSGGNVAFVVFYNYTLSPAQIVGRYNSFVAAGIENITNVELGLYPNPATNKIYISSQEFNNGFKATITDMTGKVVKEIATHQIAQPIEIDELQTGLYILHITDGEHSGVKKFVKE